ncbi:hypothetical protein MMC26_007323 [Xylographa opegraphella]|nr:hypothetical protein [Xylographa opegraphella]
MESSQRRLYFGLVGQHPLNFLENLTIGPAHSSGLLIGRAEVQAGPFKFFAETIGLSFIYELEVPTHLHPSIVSLSNGSDPQLEMASIEATLKALAKGQDDAYKHARVLRIRKQYMREGRRNIRLKGIPEQEEIAWFMQYVRGILVDTEFSDDDEDTRDARLKRNERFKKDLRDAQDDANQFLREFERIRRREDRAGRRELGLETGDSFETDDSQSELEEYGNAGCYEART